MTSRIRDTKKKAAERAKVRLAAKSLVLFVSPRSSTLETGS